MQTSNANNKRSVKTIEEENTNEFKIYPKKTRQMIKISKIKKFKLVVSWLLNCTFFVP